MEEELEALRKEREEKLKLITEKRRQVEELRRKRAERADARQAQQGGRRPSGTLGKNVDALVAEILGTEARPTAGSRAKASPEEPLRHLVADRESTRPSGDERPREERLAKLEAETQVAQEVIDPAEPNMYDRNVQTDLGEQDLSRIMQAAESGEGVEGRKGGNKQHAGVKAANVFQQMAQKTRTRGMKPPGAASAAAAVGPDGNEKEASADKDDAAKRVKELTQEEKEKIMKHADFRSFFDRTTLLVERTLGQETWDSFVDLRSSGGVDVAGQDDASELLKHGGIYEQRSLTADRPVTDVRFSPHAKEFFLAAYGQKEHPDLSDPDGRLLVWNLAMKNRPELAFTCPSAVLTAHFHRFDKQLLFGGTYAGAIVLWDARAKAGPVLRTPLNTKGHAHPVQAMEQVGTQNATNLVSASNDGRLCVWSLSMLSTPQETIELKNEGKNRKELAVTSLSFPDNETNTLYIGAEDGSVCQVHIHGTKNGVTEVYEGHEGPVTGINVHPHQGDALQHAVDASFDLALSCSFDWSVKLWTVKQHHSPVLSLDAFEDYVYDVRWHPTHPAVFASVDGEGHVDLWNLNKNLESPVFRVAPEPNQRRHALNRCYWSTDGKKLVTGDSTGIVAVYAADKSVTIPRMEDFQQFQERVRQFQPIVRSTRERDVPDRGFSSMGTRSLAGHGAGY